MENTRKALIMIIAYNASRHIGGVLSRLPEALWTNTAYKADVVVIDDCSKDDTIGAARAWLREHPLPLNVRLLRNPVNQGYGGNQKVGYTYAIRHGYEAVVMVHGDGQYPPEKIPDMLAPLFAGEADAVFGSRMLVKKDALDGGMPYYKFAGNVALTTMQNCILGSRLSEFHTGFRAYSTRALERIPFQHNSNVFHFDTDIIIQMVDTKQRIHEIPIPTHYGDEVCHVNGVRYAWDVMVSTFHSRLQKLGLLYTPKFDYSDSTVYPDKTDIPSNHSFAVSQVMPHQHVLVLGEDSGYMTAKLKEKGCHVTGCGKNLSAAMRARCDELVEMDLEAPDFSRLSQQKWDAVFIIDILSHLRSPEHLLEEARILCTPRHTRVVISTPNVGFIIPRLMLLLGQFNYSKLGTLDMTHTRLFTFASLRRTLSNAGYNLVTMQGIPAPFAVALGGTGWRARALLKLNQWLIRLSRSLFGYQTAVVAEVRPSLDWLLEQAVEH